MPEDPRSPSALPPTSSNLPTDAKDTHSESLDKADALGEQVRPKTTPAELAPDSSAAGSEALKDTGGPRENQAQRPASGLPPPSKEALLDQAIATRQKALESVLSEKEAMMLRYVFQRYPLAYYMKTKAEVKEIFNLAVIYRRRRSRRGKTTAAS
jgi:hypothetical protein